MTEAERLELITTLYESVRLAERAERAEGFLPAAADLIALAESSMRTLGAELVRVPDDPRLAIAGRVMNWRYIEP